MTSLTTEEIKACIPHRSPFLWLDEVTELDNNHLVAKKYLPEDLDIFAGHYPDFPVFPGVLQQEACFQGGAVLIAKTADMSDGKVPVITRVNNVQFRRMVRPGDTIEVTVELTEQLSNAFYMKAKVTVEGKVTARLEFVATAAPSA
ncbi:UNVERIFIED_CONTAM: hypothetical protein GTU68_053202 [Idotea baltica]|nr:hypothetical protein [Idotea baltica]